MDSIKLGAGEAQLGWASTAQTKANRWRVKLVTALSTKYKQRP